MQRFLLQKIGISLLLMLMIFNIASAISVDEIVDNFKKKYEKISNFSTDFEQTTIVVGNKRVANGKLIFQKPNLLKQKYLDPANPEHMTQLIISDGQTLWSYTPLVNQATRQQLVQDESRMELLPGFGRSMENIEKNYSLSLIEDELAEKRGIHVVELKPKSHYANSSSMFDVLQVWIKDEDSVPVQFMYKDEKNEMTFILSFKNIKVNEDLDKSIFKFEVPKGVQVITIPNR